MNAAQLNPDQLADRVGISDQAIRNIVDDRVRRSRPSTMASVCRALGLDLAEVSEEIGLPADLGPVKLPERARYLSAANRRLLGEVALAMVDAQLPVEEPDEQSAVVVTPDRVETGHSPRDRGPRSQS